MGFKKFRYNLILRVVLLTISILLVFILFGSERYRISTILIGFLAIFQVFLLIRYVERTNRKLTQFFQAIRHADFSSSFSDPGLGKSFEDLNLEFNRVIDEFKKYRAEKEEHFNYLQTVVQHVSIGIIAFRKDGKIDIYNNAIKRLLKLKNVRYVQDLKEVKEDLPETLLSLRAGESSVIKIFIREELFQLSVNTTEFRLRGEDYVLLSIQNISAELDEKEIESWQKLIRVLTHEITNSITPITSLAATIRDMLFVNIESRIALQKLDEEDIESVDGAIETIQNRSQGLLNFVDIYRNLTRIPKPNFKYFRVSEIFDRSKQLLKPKMDRLGIGCDARVFPPDMMITADPDLVDQVVINLMLNAIDAVKEVEMPQISILATLNSNNRVVIDIKDNGTGIKPDILDKIFMPFFTSKKHGSGIGLSLSRQIMHLHKGSITVKSKLGEGTVFTLTF
jgi:nitrogen fixation/metabolism regulation signal transduction histidine kinase